MLLLKRINYFVLMKRDSIMGESSEDYSAFEERVKKTVYVGDLSPQATDVVLKAALGQFGNVVKVEFIPNYLHPELPRAALVEMSKPSEAREIISDMKNSPFMISGMPRPVRVVAAEPRMFDNRPKKSGAKITLCWLKGDDPKFEEARKMKGLVRKQDAEANYLIKRQLEEEEKLADLQSVLLKANYKKFELVDGVFGDNTAYRLAQKYKMQLKDAA